MDAYSISPNTACLIFMWTALIAAFSYFLGSKHSVLFPPSPSNPIPRSTQPTPITPPPPQNPIGTLQNATSTPPPAPVLPSIETPIPCRRRTPSSSSVSAIPPGMYGRTEKAFLASAKTAFKNMNGEFEYRNRRMKEIVDMAEESFEKWLVDNEEMRKRAIVTPTPTRSSSAQSEGGEEEGEKENGK